MKRVVITGPTGEIGIALIKFLIEKKIQILAICRPGSKRRKYIPDSSYVNIMECDLSNLNSIQSSETYDVFFHFGWCASYGEERENLYLQNLNVKYELDAVGLASRLGCKTFIGAGTQAEYGRKKEPLRPDTQTIPETAYGAAKLCAGQFSRFACRKKGMEHIWVRITSVYGPCDGPYTLITYIMRQLLHNQNVELTPCEQIWDYLYSKDAAKAFYMIAEYGKNEKIYCLGGGEEKRLLTYMQDIEKIIRKYNCKSELQIGKKSYSENQMMFLSTDISELQKDTGFSPETDFLVGIDETYQWYLQHKE